VRYKRLGDSNAHVATYGTTSHQTGEAVNDSYCVG